MSGVYIKGFRPPEKSDLYYVKVEQEPGGNPVATIWRRDLLGSVSFGAFESINVPEHGRLIDADVLITTFCEWGTRLERGRKLVITMSEAKQAIADIVEDAPTIIPADKEADT